MTSPLEAAIARQSQLLGDMGHLSSARTAQWDVQAAVVREGRWALYLDTTLASWSVFIDAEHSRAFTHPTTWDTVSTTEMATANFCGAFLAAGLLGGLHQVDTADPVLQRAARVQQGLSRPGETAADRDRLVSLRTLAQSLVVQAASLNLSATRTQSRLFSLRYADLRERLVALETDLAEVRGMVELAGTAYVDTLW